MTRARMPVSVSRRNRMSMAVVVLLAVAAGAAPAPAPAPPRQPDGSLLMFSSAVFRNSTARIEQLRMTRIDFGAPADRQGVVPWVDQARLDPGSVRMGLQ